MARRHLTTGITLLVLVGILVAGVLLGVKTLLAPIGKESTPAAAPTPTCTTKTVKKGQRIRSSQVQVSVLNAGTRSGLADETLVSLTNRGFKRGEAGNAPSTIKVRRVQVWTTEANDTAAKLVARQFGKNTIVHVSKVNLGPGIDVVVGDSFDKLVKAKRVMVVRKTSSVCVPVPSPSTTASPNS